MVIYCLNFVPWLMKGTLSSSIIFSDNNTITSYIMRRWQDVRGNKTILLQYIFKNSTNITLNIYYQLFNTGKITE